MEGEVGLYRATKNGPQPAVAHRQVQTVILGRAKLPMQNESHAPDVDHHLFVGSDRLSAKVFASRAGAITIRENSKSPMWGKPTSRASETGHKPPKGTQKFGRF
jgi:hypothetical protein